MQVYRIAIAARIRDYRKAHRLSQGEFGELMGVSPQAVNKWEHEISCPDILLLPLLAEVLGCRVDDFFERKGKREGKREEHSASG